jgi:alpha-D-ribose 1-methylphosphonate 5-triphosphate synthase subunit PhnI
MRQSPNFRMNARGRPHRLHRLMRRDENFGFRFAFSTSAFFAMCSP